MHSPTHISAVPAAVAGGRRKSEARTFLFSEDNRLCPNKLKKSGVLIPLHHRVQQCLQSQRASRESNDASSRAPIPDVADHAARTARAC
nr:hypothetical protein CFP56_14042 [Quercus suber]